MVRDGTLPIVSMHGLDEFGETLKADAAHGRSGNVILVSCSCGLFGVSYSRPAPGPPPIARNLNP